MIAQTLAILRLRPSRRRGSAGGPVLPACLLLALSATDGICALAEEATAELPSPLSLPAAEAYLVHSNLALAAARAGIDAARAQQVIAGYRPDPTLTVSAEQFDLARPLDHLGSDTGSAANRFYTVRVDQELELGGRRERRSDNAAFLQQAAEAQAVDALRQARFTLAQAFWSTALADENLRVAEENQRLAANTEKLISDQVGAGNKSESDLIAFQVSRIQFEQDLAGAQLARDQAMVDLATVLGLEPARLATGPGGAKRELAAQLAITPVELPRTGLDEALMRRGDVVAAHRSYDAARSAVALARAQRSIDPTIGLEYQRNGGTNTVGFAASLPLPMWNNHEGEIAQAEALERQAQAQLVLAERQAQADLEKAWQAYGSSRRLLAIYSAETLAKAKRALDIAKTSYQNGATGLVEVLDAQRTYNQIRVATNQAHFACRIGLAQLAQATGMDLPQP